MAPPRKLVEAAEPGRMHAVHVRLPNDVFMRLDARATAEGRSMNRVLADELAEFPSLEKQAPGLDELLRKMRVIVAQHRAFVRLVEFNEGLLRAVDTLLGARTDEQRWVATDRLRLSPASPC